MCASVCGGFIDAGAVVRWEVVLVMIIAQGGEGLAPLFHWLVMPTSSEGSVYNLLPTTCTFGGKKTSFQDGRQGAENQPQVNPIRG